MFDSMSTANGCKSWGKDHPGEEGSWESPRLCFGLAARDLVGAFPLVFELPTCNIGALIIRLGFGVYYTIIILRNPPKPYSTY